MQQRLPQFLQKPRPSHYSLDHLLLDAVGGWLTTPRTDAGMVWFKQFAKAYQNRRKVASVFGFVRFFATVRRLGQQHCRCWQPD